jgi:glycosyltransferase involved in cell wall biosynthesis
VRVALVFRNFNMGGSLERDAMLHARALVDAGADVHAYRNPDTSVAELAGVAFHDIRPLTVSRSRLGYPLECASFATSATRALRRDRGRYDIVDVHGTATWEQDVVTVHAVTKAEQRRWPFEAGKEYRAARLRAYLGPLTRPQLGVARSIERLQFRRGRFERVIAVAESVRNDVVHVHGVDPALIHVIPNPIDLDRFTNAGRNGAREHVGLEAKDAVLLFVGHDFERKGLGDAIAALTLVRHPRAHLLVVGAGDSERYRRQAARAGVADRVHFVGRTEAPENFYAEADLFLFPTRHDPGGLPLLEAMAAGVPIVATRLAGSAPQVEAAGAGVFVPDRAPRELAEAVTALLDDPARARAMGARGPEAARPFGLRSYGSAVVATYEDVLRARPAYRRTSESCACGEARG